MPVTPTYDLIASNVLSSSASSVTFSSIPATYRDLVLVVTGNVPTPDAAVALRFNSDTGSNYSAVRMQGNGSAASSGTETGTYVFVAATQVFLIAASQTLIRTSIMDYSATDKHKTILSRADNAGLGTDARAGRWASTSAINSVQVFLPFGNTFVTGNTFYLYGIVS